MLRALLGVVEGVAWREEASVLVLLPVGENGATRTGAPPPATSSVAAVYATTPVTVPTLDSSCIDTVSVDAAGVEAGCPAVVAWVCCCRCGC